MVLPGYFPPDIRVEKEARALIANEHVLYLICMGKEGQVVEENFNGIIVKRIVQSSDMDGTFKSLLNEPIFLNPRWIKRWSKKIREVVRDNDIDALHVHDLPLVSAAITIGRINGIPVIFDMHENWPEAIRVYEERRVHGWKFWNVLLHKTLEKYCVKNANHIIVVVDEQRDRLIELGIPGEKITVVMNTVDLDVFNDFNVDNKLVDRYKNDFVISYIGTFGPHRGLDTAINAMPIISEKISNAKLLIVGKGSNEKELKDLSKNLGIEDKVIFTGWIELRNVPSYLTLSNVCLVTPQASGHTNTTIPHKLFHYMYMKKPVIVTDAKPLKRIIEETNCGVVVPSGSSTKMGEAAIRLYENKDYAKMLGENGEKAVKEKYNWKNEGKKLVALYRNIEEEYVGKKC